ncbi:MAG: flagellar transcriptional regulator FlhC [Gammaproteobacteria bacterium]|nr:flagellar transcriptional regulator FlhC [Gammaproteobacteria bacterium]
MLIRRGMRISIVSSITGINQKILRVLHHDIHGRGPVAGQLPSTGGILSTRTMQATASVFAALYRSVGSSDIFDGITLDALITAHDLYLELCQGLITITPNTMPINTTQAWIIARDIGIGAAYFRNCRHCRIHYLLPDDSRLSPTCPICALKKRGSGQPLTMD